MKYFINTLNSFIIIFGVFQILVFGERSYVEKIYPERGDWGEERGWRFCSPNKWATGFRLKVEADAPRADDTAMNAMELVCADVNKDGHEQIKDKEGYWGDWGNHSYCPSANDFLSSVRFRIEPNQGAGIAAQDDTAANDVQFLCSRSGFRVESTNGGKFGDWKSFTSCPAGSAICGFSLIWEDKQYGLDDTTANGAVFACCRLNPCLPSPCQNGAICTAKSDGINYSCSCEFTAFSGKNCDQPCVNDKKCLNGGTCQYNVCYCRGQYEGFNCEFIKDSCKSQPCRNKGVCIQDGLLYRCNCELTGYQGINCETPCNNNKPCYNNATCNNDVCACPSAFEGPSCETPKLSCDRSPCKNDAPCLFDESGLHCDCRNTGWQGNMCDQPCINGLRCQNGGVCSDSTCLCRLPFAGTNCEQFIEPKDVAKCNVWGDPHLKMFGQYPGAIRDQYICSDSGTFPLLVNRLINATVTTTPDHPWFVFEYYISFFGISGKVLCSLSHLNTSGCENNSIIIVQKSRSSLNIKYLNNYLRVLITSLANGTVAPEMKYYNIEIELDYYSIIGESTGLCVTPMSGCQFEIQSRRRKREINSLRKAQPTIEEKTVSQMAEPICQLYIDEATKLAEKVNIAMSALISHYIIEDLLAACVYDLETTGNKELAESSVYVLLSEGMMFLPPMNDTAYTIFWNEGLQLISEILAEVKGKLANWQTGKLFFREDIYS